MKSRGIAFKLFVMTLLLFILFLGIQFASYNFVIGNYYENKKIATLSEDIDSLAKSLEKNLKSGQDYNKLLNNFSGQKNVAVALINRYGNPEYGLNGQYKSSFIQVKDNSGKRVNVYIDGLLQNTNLDKEMLISGTNLEVLGEVEEDKASEMYIFPYEIKIDGRIYKKLGVGGHFSQHDDTNTLDNDEESDLTRVAGQIVLVHVSEEKGSNNFYKEQILSNYITQLTKVNKIEELMTRNQLSYNRATDKSVGVENIIFTMPLNLTSKNSYLLLVTTSLQPVEDAITILMDFNIYFFMLAMLLAIMAAYTYSQFISKPLIHMKEVAADMADLKFDRRCNMERKDEIGDLAGSLNQLSDNLENSLMKLKIANKQLVSDIEKEREQEKRRREFVANLSHELKTPLTVIEGIASGMRDGIYNRGGGQLDSLIGEVKHMNSLIYEMLQLSRIEAENYHLEEGIFDVGSVTLKVHSKLKTLVLSKSIEVSMNYKEAVVKGDAKAIEQVITNLYTNAIRYTKGSEKIIIQLEEKSQQVIFSIENTGASIPEELLEDIWKPFYRIEKSRNKKFGGTGLGLNIVRSILDLHKSEYGVKNTPTGVLFFFTLERWGGR